MNDDLPGVALRPADANDFEFWCRVHRTCFKKYVEETWGAWDDADQLQRLQREFVPMRGNIILLDSQQIGFFWVEDQDTVLFIESIAILPEYQNRGIGTKLVQQVIATAQDRKIPVRLQVLKVNPARDLYERLGFRVTGEDDYRYHMEWMG